MRPIILPYIKKWKLVELRGKIDKYAIIMGNFNISLTITDSVDRQKPKYQKGCGISKQDKHTWLNWYI